MYAIGEVQQLVNERRNGLVREAERARFGSGWQRVGDTMSQPSGVPDPGWAPRLRWGRPIPRLRTCASPPCYQALLDAATDAPGKR
jgi:hypothetical protein